MGGAIERAYTTLGTMTRDDDTINWTRQEYATRVASGAITANRGLAAYRRQLATSKDDAEALKAILKWKTSAEWDKTDKKQYIYFCYYTLSNKYLFFKKK